METALEDPSSSLLNRPGVSFPTSKARSKPSRRPHLMIKRVLFQETIDAISQNFPSAQSPTLLAIPEYEHSERYDRLITGWTEHWNRLFRVETPLESHWVKALIAAASGFDAHLMTALPHGGCARGLLQVSDKALVTLSHPKSVLKHYIFSISPDRLFDPSTNICVGVRWLFWKRRVASLRLKRPASWEETIAESKGCLAQMVSLQTPAPSEMEIIKGFLIRGGALSGNTVFHAPRPLTRNLRKKF